MTDHYLNCAAVLVRLSPVTPDVLQDLLGMAHKFVTAQASLRSPSQTCLIPALKQAKAEYAKLQ